MNNYEVEFYLSSSYMVESESEKTARKKVEDALNEKVHFIENLFKTKIKNKPFVTDVIHWKDLEGDLKDYEVHFVLRGLLVLKGTNEEQVTDEVNSMITKEIGIIEEYMGSGFVDICGYVEEARII